jgi:hypothetical protein
VESNNDTNEDISSNKNDLAAMNNNNINMNTVISNVATLPQSDISKNSVVEVCYDIFFNNNNMLTN